MNGKAAKHIRRIAKQEAERENRPEKAIYKDIKKVYKTISKDKYINNC